MDQETFPATDEVDFNASGNGDVLEGDDPDLPNEEEEGEPEPEPEVQTSESSDEGPEGDEEGDDLENVESVEWSSVENAQSLEPQNLEMPLELPQEPAEAKEDIFEETGASFEPHPLQEAQNEKNNPQASIPLPEKTPISESNPIAQPCCSNPAYESFDFGMVSFGIEGGVSFGHHDYNYMFSHASSGSYSSNQGLLGLRANWEKMLEDHWTAGITLAMRYYFGSAEGNHNTIPAFQQNYKAENFQRYELSGKFGKWVGGFHPYAKVGGVLGSFRTQASDSTFSYTSKQWMGGATLGLGVETEITKGVLAGGMMEYDRYLMIKNNLVNATGVGSNYKVNPSFLSAIFTLSCKLDKFF